MIIVLVGSGVSPDRCLSFLINNCVNKANLGLEFGAFRKILEKFSWMLCVGCGFSPGSFPAVVEQVQLPGLKLRSTVLVT